MLEDTAGEMIAAYFLLKEDGLPIPQGHMLFESITIEDVPKTAVSYRSTAEIRYVIS